MPTIDKFINNKIYYDTESEVTAMTKKEKKWYHKESVYDKEKGEYTYKTNYWKVASITTLIPAIILLSISLVLMANWTTNIGVPVRREFSNYITSAKDMYDPHLVIQNLQRSIQGIENLGLEPTDNAAIVSWDKNYKHTPQFTIDQITSVIAFADSFIEWKEQSYYNTTVIEVAADVYNDKMYNLRKITDDISTNTVAFAYCLKTPGCLWCAYDGALFIIGLFTLLAAAVFGLISTDM